MEGEHFITLEIDDEHLQVDFPPDITDEEVRVHQNVGAPRCGGVARTPRPGHR